MFFGFSPFLTFQQHLEVIIGKHTYDCVQLVRSFMFVPFVRTYLGRWGDLWETVYLFQQLDAASLGTKPQTSACFLSPTKPYPP